VISSYYDKAAVDEQVRSGQHRNVVGGLWEEIGQLQFDFLLSRGLKPHHKFLDIGCGSLRAGVKLVRYLDAGNYFGTDINESLLRAGYEIELAREGLIDRLPQSQLVTDGEFDFSWCAVSIDFVLAQSVFTHLPLNFIRACLERLYPAVTPGGKFFATVFEIPEHHPTYRSYRHEPGGVVTSGQRDPYHYRVSDIEFCARNLPWSITYIGEWDHPRAQRMIQFTKSN
jgi:SAM-dependent methyltransferase